MSSSAWELIASPLERDDSPWELYHENSKATPQDPFLSAEAAQVYLAQMPESLQFDAYPEVKLAESAPLSMQLDHAITHRSLPNELEPCSLTAGTVATLLHYAYGTTGDEPEGTPRRRRAVYSAGALFPLEIFLHCSRVAGMAPGIYHYDPPGARLRFLRGGDQSQKLAPALMDGRIAQTAALTLFIAAMPERSVLRYGDRGYRFALLEAGAVVQNLNLVASALGLACMNVGEFFDRQIDDVLNLDGLTISTLYVVAIGKPAREEAVPMDRETGHAR